MNRTYIPNQREVRFERGIKPLPILILFGLVFFSGIVFLVVTSDNLNFLTRPYLLPWVFAMAIVVAVPNIYLFYKNKFLIYHPIVFPTLFYFFPAFVFGGLVLVFGLSDPYFIAFIQDQETNLPYTMVIAILGFSGLSAGFFIPFGKTLGSRAGAFLPSLEWDDDKVIGPGLFLLGLGFVNQIIGFFLGLVGFQKMQEIGTYDGLIFLTTLLWIQASFVLWVALFRRNKLDFVAVATISALIVTSLIKALFSGSRGALLQIFITVILSYVFAGRTIKFKQGFIIATLMFVLLIIGMIYGTTFRQVKGSEERVDSGKYIDSIYGTFDTIGTASPVTILQQSLSTLGERIDAVSSLAVVVSNYEQLRPYEDAYGLDNNIYKDSVTFFIPRVIWKDKPVASEPRLYSELYFNFGESSFTITPMGDLLRNFGLIGVPIGMIILGFIIRILYSSLVENQPFSYWRATFYFMVVPSISYESFYGAIIPYMFKVGFITVVGILIMHFLMNKVIRKN